MERRSILGKYLIALGLFTDALCLFPAKTRCGRWGLQPYSWKWAALTSSSETAK